MSKHPSCRVVATGCYRCGDRGEQRTVRPRPCDIERRGVRTTRNLRARESLLLCADHILLHLLFLARLAERDGVLPCHLCAVAGAVIADPLARGFVRLALAQR